MAIQVQIRRGTTAENSTFTGAVGELTVDTTKDTVVVHDGSTAGGFPLAKESQATTSAAITGGAIDNTTIGATTASTGAFTNLAYTGTLTGGTGVVNLGSGQLFKDASGNVGIGTSSILGGAKTVIAQNSEANYSTTFTTGTTKAQLVLRDISNTATFATPFSTLVFGAGNFGSGWSAISGVRTSSENSALTFATASGNTNPIERLRIDSSGNLLVGTTSSVGTSAARFEVNGIGTDGRAVNTRVNTTGSANQLSFNNPNGQVGSISTSGSSTAYNTSSDYRLKHDIQPMTGALAKVAALKPCTYKWNADNSADEGFIAHELQEVCPRAVTGEKDAVNKDGSINPQGIDTSFLVATLTAALQELNAKFDAYVASHP